MLGEDRPCRKQIERTTEISVWEVFQEKGTYLKGRRLTEHANMLGVSSLLLELNAF